ncbi:MAG: hypothetical protein RLZZ158_103 [Cyanobacteriota bacterium]|jgi:hypothetical protein
MRFLQQVGPCLGGFVTDSSPNECHAGYGPPSNGTHFLTPTQSSGRPPELFLYLEPLWSPMDLSWALAGM